MRSVATKNSEIATADNGVAPQSNCLGNGSGHSGPTQDYLRQLAQTVMVEISKLDLSHSNELLGTFVSELFLVAEEQKRREVRRQKQAEGIAAAKERGVQFGRERMELPEGFPEFARLWQEGGISSRRAAKELGINYRTFLRRAKEYCAVHM